MFWDGLVFVSVFRWNCGLHPSGAENAVLYAATVWRLYRSPVSAIYAVSITFSPAPLRHGHQVYVLGDIGRACRNIYSGKGYSWNVCLAL
jgi:hypothetical protein